jgi:hypothetical protein
MLYLKEIPKGIDVPVQRYQKYLYGELPAIWQIDEGQYDCFGRAYRNRKGNGYVPEVYCGSNEYRDVYVDDCKSAISFFGVEDIQKFDISLIANVYLIFCINLKKTYPDVGHRADGEAHRDAVNVSDQYQFGKFTGLITGIDTVFKGYDLKQIKYGDMHPLHCFRLNYTLSYVDECP